MEKIFVSVASYRDRRCSTTIMSLFEKAKYPERVIVGVCEQNKNDKELCTPKNFKYAKQIRVIHKHYKEAKGPTFARYLCSTLFADEDFFLQIDSHSLLVKDWDVKCIEMIYALEKSSTVTNKKVMLSHYPPSWESYKENADNKYVTHLVDCFFNNHGIISFRGAKWKPPGPLPRRNAFLAGGFIFSRGAWLREVPFDPHLDFLFTGEEILLSARSFTHGWDVYTPNQNIIFHAYTRKKEPKFWTDTIYNNEEAREKVKIIIGLSKDVEKLKTPRIRDSLIKYGLGNIRTLPDFYKLIGVDHEQKKIINRSIEFFENPEPFYKNFGNQLIFGLLLLLLVL